MEDEKFKALEAQGYRPAIIEKMGHQKFGAMAAQREFMGSKSLHVVSFTEPSFEQDITNPASLYGVTYCTEAQARAASKRSSYGGAYVPEEMRLALPAPRAKLSGTEVNEDETEAEIVSADTSKGDITVTLPPHRPGEVFSIQPADEDQDFDFGGFADPAVRGAVDDDDAHEGDDDEDEPDPDDDDFDEEEEEDQDLATEEKCPDCGRVYAQVSVVRGCATCEGPPASDTTQEYRIDDEGMGFGRLFLRARPGAEVHLTLIAGERITAKFEQREPIPPEGEGSYTFDSAEDMPTLIKLVRASTGELLAKVGLVVLEAPEEEIEVPARVDMALLVVPPGRDTGNAFPGLVYAYDGKAIRDVLRAEGISDCAIQGCDLELPGTGDLGPGMWVWRGDYSQRKGSWRRATPGETGAVIAGRVPSWEGSFPEREGEEPSAIVRIDHADLRILAAGGPVEIKIAEGLQPIIRIEAYPPTGKDFEPDHADPFMARALDALVIIDDPDPAVDPHWKDLALVSPSGQRAWVASGLDGETAAEEVRQTFAPVLAELMRPAGAQYRVHTGPTEPARDTGDLPDAALEHARKHIRVLPNQGTGGRKFGVFIDNLDGSVARLDRGPFEESDAAFQAADEERDTLASILRGFAERPHHYDLEIARDELAALARGATVGLHSKKGEQPLICVRVRDPHMADALIIDPTKAIRDALAIHDHFAPAEGTHPAVIPTGNDTQILTLIVPMLAAAIGLTRGRGPFETPDKSTVAGMLPAFLGALQEAIAAIESEAGPVNFRDDVKALELVVDRIHDSAEAVQMGGDGNDEAPSGRTWDDEFKHNAALTAAFCFIAWGIEAFQPETTPPAKKRRSSITTPPIPAGGAVLEVTVGPDGIKGGIMRTATRTQVLGADGIEVNGDGSISVSGELPAVPAEREIVVTDPAGKPVGKAWGQPSEFVGLSTIRRIEIDRTTPEGAQIAEAITRGPGLMSISGQVGFAPEGRIVDGKQVITGVALVEAGRQSDPLAVGTVISRTPAGTACKGCGGHLIYSRRMIGATLCGPCERAKEAAASGVPDMAAVIPTVDESVESFLEQNPGVIRPVEDLPDHAPRKAAVIAGAPMLVPILRAPEDDGGESVTFKRVDVGEHVPAPAEYRWPTMRAEDLGALAPLAAAGLLGDPISGDPIKLEGFGGAVRNVRIENNGDGTATRTFEYAPPVPLNFAPLADRETIEARARAAGMTVERSDAPATRLLPFDHPDAGTERDPGLRMFDEPLRIRLPSDWNPVDPSPIVDAGLASFILPTLDLAERDIGIMADQAIADFRAGQATTAQVEAARWRFTGDDPSECETCGQPESAHVRAERFCDATPADIADLQERRARGLGDGDTPRKPTELEKLQAWGEDKPLDVPGMLGMLEGRRLGDEPRALTDAGAELDAAVSRVDAINARIDAAVGPRPPEGSAIHDLGKAYAGFIDGVERSRAELLDPISWEGAAEKDAANAEQSADLFAEGELPVDVPRARFTESHQGVIPPPDAGWTVGGRRVEQKVTESGVVVAPSTVKGGDKRRVVVGWDLAKPGTDTTVVAEVEGGKVKRIVPQGEVIGGYAYPDGARAAIAEAQADLDGDPTLDRRGANWTNPGTGEACFLRTEGPSSETCAGCGKLIRDHFGMLEYRCYERPSVGEVWVKKGTGTHVRVDTVAGRIGCVYEDLRGDSIPIAIFVRDWAHDPKHVWKQEPPLSSW